MANIKISIMSIFRDSWKFSLLEAVLITATIAMLFNEIDYWVFTAFFAVLAGLFYLGVNYDYIIGNKQRIIQKKEEDEIDMSVFNELQRIADDARASMSAIKEIELELDEMKKSVIENTRR